jgi:long-chain acyl-CoA synthetase
MAKTLEEQGNGRAEREYIESFDDNRLYKKGMEETACSMRGGVGSMSIKTSIAKGTDFVCPDTSLFEALEATVGQHGERPALRFYDRVISYSDLMKGVEQLSAFLHAQGVQEGDRVGIMLPNCPHYVVAFYACARLGAVVAQINPMYTPREVQYTLQDSGAKALVVLDRLYGNLASLQETGALNAVVAVSFGESLLPENVGGNVTAWDAAIFHALPVPQPATVNPAEDVAVLQYTGGTTGRSKGAMLTHRNLVANAWQTIESLGRDKISPEDKYLVVIPLFHIYGMSVAMNVSIFMGCSQILLPRFDVEEVLNTIKMHRPRFYPGVPTMYVAIANHPQAEEYGVDAIEICNSGSAPLPVEVMKRFEQRTGATILEGFGLSEASPVTHSNRQNAPRKPGSIGLPAPGTMSRIVDLGDGTRDVAIGEIGELVVQGPQVMKGYWNMPEETAVTLRDGWLYTGDIARMDEDGYTYIVDRKKDMIISSGYNVYPRDVEEVLYQHPNVREAVVVGAPDEYRGETVKAFVVLKDGAAQTPELEKELDEWCRERLAPYKIPRIYEVREELPKTPVGKILRRALRAN